MSATLKPAEIDAIVFSAIEYSGGRSRDSICRATRSILYPNGPFLREQAIRRSLQRLRKAGRIVYRDHVWIKA